MEEEEKVLKKVKKFQNWIFFLPRLPIGFVSVRGPKKKRISPEISLKR